MGYGTGSFLTEDQKGLLRVAKGALPPEFFQNGGDSEELPGAYSIEMAAAKTSIDTDYHRSMIIDSTGIWLDQHARDRGTNRQANESDQSLQNRLRSFDPSVTLAAISSSITSIVSGSGQAGAVGFVELRRQKAFMGTAPVVMKCVSASLISDGQTFTLTNSGVTKTFEFDKDGITAFIPVNIEGAVTPTDVAEAVTFAFPTAGYSASLDARFPDTVRIYAIGSQAMTSASGSAGLAVGLTSGRHLAYLSRGYRMGAAPPLNELIIILPSGTLDVTREAVVEQARILKAAGTRITVEQRGLHQ